MAWRLFTITLYKQQSFENHKLLNEINDSLCMKYDVHIRTIRRWKQDDQHSRFTCSVDVDNDDVNELAKIVWCSSSNNKSVEKGCG